MSHPHRSLRAAPSGITLLEVLIAMFVLAVGILSVFGLFAAGRELESRAAIKSDAIAYAGTLRNTIARQWVDAWQDWLYISGGGAFTRVGASPSPPTLLPILIDPCGLSRDTQPRSAFIQPQPPDPPWDWSRMAPIYSSDPTAQPFARVTLPAVPGEDVPLLREEALASLADQDSIEFTLPNNDTDPPINAFELGRRKRGSDFVPALLVAPTGTSALGTRLVSGRQVQRTLLIFHKPATGTETDSAGNTTWPAGYLELSVTGVQQSLIKASINRVPQDAAVIRRSLRPDNWILIVDERAPAPADWYRARFLKIKSATRSEPTSVNEWLLVLDSEAPIRSPARCYAFESLVHVVTDFEPIELP